ncbi:hypothetical protein QOT17_021566 [Balamuthia mandrillaris]
MKATRKPFSASASSSSSKKNGLKQHQEQSRSATSATVEEKWDLWKDDAECFLAAFDKLMEEAIFFHERDKLLLAYRRMKALKKTLRHHLSQENTDPTVQQELQQLLKVWQKEHVQRWKQLKKEVAEVKTVLEELLSDESWTLIKESNGVETLYRHEKDTPVHSIKIKGKMRCPILNILAVINEHTLYDRWIPLLAECRLIEQVSLYRKAIYMRGALPWPFAHRDACVFGYGVDMLEDEGMVLAVVRDCKSDDLRTSEVPAATNSSYVRSEVKIAGFVLRPISENESDIIMMANADPKFNYLPYSLLNFGTKVLSFKMFAMLEEQCKSIDNEGPNDYKEKMEASPLIYGELRSRLLEHFQPHVNDNTSSSEKKTEQNNNVTPSRF